MAQTILGLDLGSDAVKAVLFESAYRGGHVAAHASQPVAPATEGGPPLAERQAAALEALLAAQGWKPDTVVTTAPGAGLASHVITLPFTDPRRLEQALAFEVEAQIPFDLAEAAWDWQPMGGRGGGTDVWVSVGRKAELAQLLATLARGGLDPRAVVPPAPALAALLAPGVLAAEPLADAAEGPPAEAILDLGEERCSLCVTVGDQLEAARTFAFGAAALARALATDLGIDPTEAARLLAAEAGGAPLEGPLADLARDPRAGDALRRALVPLARDLRATLRAWRARVGPRTLGRLWLAGGLARLPGLPELLAAEVDGPVLPVALAPPTGDLVPADQAGPLALALALALRGSQGSRAGRVNLRRGDLSYTRDFQHLKGKVLRLASAAALVLLLGIASSGVRIFALARQEQAVDRALCDAEEKILKRCYDNWEEALSVLRGRGIPGAAIPKTSAVDVVGELSVRMPEGVSLRFDRIDITDKKLHLQGTTEAAESVDRIVTSLKASRCFTDARSGGARKRASDGKFEFSIDSALSCAEPASPGGT